MEKIKYIDLFAGLGGTRIGFSQACKSLRVDAECVFTSEIKPHAVEVYRHNFEKDQVAGDIYGVKAKEIPSFDFLLAGFPCQAFSVAGKREGFQDTRGTLFFEIERILKEKKPRGFLLENVEGLVTHDRRDQDSDIGNTLHVILENLKFLGYKVSWKVLDSIHFGVAQSRKRIYIVGSLEGLPDLVNFSDLRANFGDIQERGLPPLETKFTKRLLERFTLEELTGKSVKDKRGGSNNIHSWDLELKGALSEIQKKLLSTLLKERRKKEWAIKKRMVWMDGMPLTLDEIHSFFNCVTKIELKQLLTDMVNKKYLRFEHPKDIVTLLDGRRVRVHDESIEKGYNIVTGKLSFELNKILGESSIAPTIVATEADRIGVIDGKGIRRLSERECLRLFGFPESYSSNISQKELYDLIGNTVVVPVIKSVSQRLLRSSFSALRDAENGKKCSAG